MARVDEIMITDNNRHLIRKTPEVYPDLQEVGNDLRIRIEELRSKIDDLRERVYDLEHAGG